MTSAYRRCPRCGLPNIVERYICKRCRFDFNAPIQLRLEPATDVTGRIYRDRAGATVLFLTADLLEYGAPDITLRTLWNNVRAITTHRGAPVLVLTYPAEHNLPYSAGVAFDDRRFRRIPLWPFGYPDNRELHRDLLNYAPQLGQG